MGISKDESLQIFTFLDQNRDNLLKFADFCALIAHATANPQQLSKSVNQMFKNKKQSLETVKARVESRRSRQDNPNNIRSIENLQEGFVSKEVERYSKRSTALRNCLHSPSHNSISSASRSFQIMPLAELTPKIMRADDRKRVEIMQDRPYGMTSNEITL